MVAGVGYDCYMAPRIPFGVIAGNSINARYLLNGLDGWTVYCKRGRKKKIEKWRG